MVDWTRRGLLKASTVGLTASLAGSPLAASAQGTSQPKRGGTVTIALDEMQVEGIATNLLLHRRLVRDTAVVAGGVDIHHLEQQLRKGGRV